MLCGLEAVVVEVDHDDVAGRVEAGREKGGESDGTRSDDGDRVPGSHLAVQDAALEGRRQDVAQQHERRVLDVRRSGVEARVGERDANVFGLRPVDRVAQHPAAIRAVRGHPAPARIAGAVGADARDQHAVARPDTHHGGADFLDDTDSLVPQYAPVGDRRDVSFQNV
jgi:hypothetical protein